MKRKTREGFTLAELMVGMTIFGVLTAGVTAFFVGSLKFVNTTQQQVNLMSDMRTFSGDLLYNGSRGHELILYASPAAVDRANATSRLMIMTAEDTGDLQCPTGDLAVFVYYELPKPSNQARYRVSRIIAYALERQGDNPGTLTRLTFDFTASPSAESVEKILSDHWGTATRRVFSQLVHPLALADGVEDSIPRLFYKRSEQNLAVCGQLLRSAGNRDSRDRHTATRTMFFSVTTRS